MKKFGIILLVTLLAAGIGGAYYYYKVINANPVALLKSEFTVEYGELISIEIDDYLDKGKIKEYEKILEKCELIIDIENEVDKEYPAVGEYAVNVLYNNKKDNTFTIIVSDTTAPEFVEPALELSCVQEGTIEYVGLFTATDLSGDVTIEYDDGAVDYATVGEYTMIVSATDIHENKKELEVKIIIKAPTITLNKDSVSLYPNANVILEPTIEGKSNEVTFSSSNTSIATVSDTGKVTAVSKGTATITATANGVSATCTVTVNAMPANSTSTTKEVTNPTTGQTETVTVVEEQVIQTTPNITGNLSAAQEAFNLQNQYRSELGLGQLSWDNTVYTAALIRCEEIMKLQSHTRPDGRRFNTVLVDLGYKYSLAGENLGGGYSQAASIIKAWQTSASHNANMVKSSYTRGAIAMYNNYWVALYVQ